MKNKLIRRTGSLFLRSLSGTAMFTAASVLSLSVAGVTPGGVVGAGASDRTAVPELTLDLAAGGAVSPAGAGTGEIVEDKADRLADQAKEVLESSTPLTSAEIQDLTRVVQGSALRRQGPGQPDYSTAYGVTLEGGGRLLTVPLRGVNLTRISNLTFVLDERVRVVHFSELVMTALDERHGHGRFWADNQLRTDLVVDDQGNTMRPGEAATAAIPSTGGVVAAGDDLDLVAYSPTKMFKCMDSYGLLTYELAFIALLCTAACPAVVPCVICVLGFGAVLSSALYECVVEAGGAPSISAAKKKIRDALGL